MGAKERVPGRCSRLDVVEEILSGHYRPGVSVDESSVEEMVDDEGVEDESDIIEQVVRNTTPAYAGSDRVVDEKKRGAPDRGSYPPATIPLASIIRLLPLSFFRCKEPKGLRAGSWGEARKQNKKAKF